MRLETILEAINTLEVAFNTKQKKELSEIWMQEFSDVTDNQFKKAVSWWIKHHDRFPTIHQLHIAIKEVGGPGSGKKQEIYEWIDKEDFSRYPVLYYFKLGGYVYSCVLVKNPDDPAEPPEEFENEYGVKTVREDIWEKEHGKDWKLVRIQEANKKREEQRKTSSIKDESIEEKLEGLKRKILESMKV